MKLMQQQDVHVRPSNQRIQRQLCCCSIILHFTSLQLIEIVSGFRNQPGHVQHIATSSTINSNQLYDASFWAPRNCRSVFIKVPQNRYHQLLRHQMQLSDISINSTSLPSISSTPNATTTTNTRMYDLGVGKNPPLNSSTENPTIISPTPASATDGQSSYNKTSFDIDKDYSSIENDTAVMNARLIGIHWMVPESVVKPSDMMKNDIATSTSTATNQNVLQPDPSSQNRKQNTKIEKKTRRMVARDNEGQILRGALWDEQHFDLRGNNRNGGMVDNVDASGIIPLTRKLSDNRRNIAPTAQPAIIFYGNNYEPPYPKAFYHDIDLSIPDSVYSDDVDLVWDLLRYEAYKNQQEQHEPLLVSFLHSTILNHDTLESSLAFLLANRLQSPAMMISTQLQALILSALQDCAQFRRKLRADIMAVRDRDPACHTLPDVFLYFKGFHALQSYRTAHVLWNSGRTILAQYLQSQVSQIFQIDIHPNATIGSGIMLDHGTGIVIGETATVGHNCSILHHVTLGGSGKKGIIRHPAVGNGVLLGAGATVLGPITIGDGCQVGAGTLVISDLPPHCVAVGVPARIIGSFVDVTEQPSIGMDQIMESRDKIVTFESDGI